MERVLESHGRCESLKLSRVRIGHWKHTVVAENETQIAYLSLGVGHSPPASPQKDRSRPAVQNSPASARSSLAPNWEVEEVERAAEERARCKPVSLAELLKKNAPAAEQRVDDERQPTTALRGGSGETVSSSQSQPVTVSSQFAAEWASPHVETVACERCRALERRCGTLQVEVERESERASDRERAAAQNCEALRRAESDARAGQEWKREAASSREAARAATQECETLQCELDTQKAQLAHALERSRAQHDRAGAARKAASSN